MKDDYTTPIKQFGQPSELTLEELLPPLPEEDQAEYLRECRKIADAEHAGWLMIQPIVASINRGP